MTSEDAFAVLANQLAEEIAAKVRERLIVTGPDERAAFSFDETGAKLDVSSRSIRRLVENGTLRSVKIGVLVRIPATAISDFLKGGGTG